MLFFLGTAVAFAPANLINIATSVFKTWGKRSYFLLLPWFSQQ